MRRYLAIVIALAVAGALMPPVSSAIAKPMVFHTKLFGTIKVPKKVCPNLC